MILGIVGLVFGFIPVVGAFIAFPCIIVGLPLSSIGLYQDKKNARGGGMSITGIATNVVALIVVILWLAVLGAAAATL